MPALSMVCIGDFKVLNFASRLYLALEVLLLSDILRSVNVLQIFKERVIRFRKSQRTETEIQY